MDTIKIENPTESRLTPEMAGMLGLVKKSTLENHQKKQTTTAAAVVVDKNNTKEQEDEMLTNNKTTSMTTTTTSTVSNNENGTSTKDHNTNNGDNSSDIKIIDEKITKTTNNNQQEQPPTIKEVKNENSSKEEEKIEIKLIPEEFILDDEEIGFPAYLKGWVARGRTIPINKKTWTAIDIECNDAILECPSQVVPFFIKKPHQFPPKEEKKNENEKAKPAASKEKDMKEIKKEEDDKKVEEKEVENKNEEKSTTTTATDDKEVKTEQNDKEKSPATDQQQQNGDKSSEQEKDEKSTAEVVDEATKNKQQQQKKQTEQLNNNLTMLSIDDYYKSSVGNFLMGIGLRRCQETYLQDAVKQTKKLIKKEGELEEHVQALKSQQEQFEDCKSVNSIYTFKQEKCKMCDFKTDSDSVMEYHLSIPHLTNRKEYKCNFCTFMTRDARIIVYHFLNDHKKHCNIELPLNLYNCPTCNYESNQKAKAATHMAKCAQTFQEDKVQQTVDNEQEYPAITSKLITKDDLNLYESTVQALKPVVMNPVAGMQMPFVSGLPRGLQQQILIMQQQQFARQKLIKQPKQTTANNQQRHFNLVNMRQQNNNSTITTINTPVPIGLATGLNSNLVNNINFAKAPQLYHMLQAGSLNKNQLLTNLHQVRQQNSIQNTVAGAVATAASIKLPQQLNNNRTTIVQPINSAAMIQKTFNNNLKTTTSTTAMINKNNNNNSNKDPNGKETFVICEICDGYIKDLEQLRSHMSWVHKVKIHSKMIVSRPPLNCQKCQWRFFTDQGLERHLLGAHGLVTSNMQDLVDQNLDGGRCTICGRQFASKLVDHMNKAHKTTLRPAHLSYKCTVCSATFNLYRLFESHVYMVHSSSKRLNNDEQLNQLNKKPRTHTIEIGKSTVNGQS